MGSWLMIFGLGLWFFSRTRVKHETSETKNLICWFCHVLGLIKKAAPKPNQFGLSQNPSKFTTQFNTPKIAYCTLQITRATLHFRKSWLIIMPNFILRMQHVTSFPTKYGVHSPTLPTSNCRACYLLQRRVL